MLQWAKQEHPVKSILFCTKLTVVSLLDMSVLNYDILYMTMLSLKVHGNSIKPVFCSCKACIYSAKQLFNCIMTWLNHYYKWHRAATLPYDMIEWQKIS